MYGLTLWQPFAWAVPYCKDFENRDWPPHEGALGERLAIHAAVRKDIWAELNVFERWREKGEPVMTIKTMKQIEDLPRGAITSVATLLGWVEIEEGKIKRVYTLDPHDRARVAERAAVSVHASGPYAWYLERRIALPHPIPCRGYQRLWHVPPEIERQIVKQLAILERNSNE